MEVPVQAAWPPIRVYGLPQPWREARGWIAQASSPQELEPGDIWALPPAGEAERLRAAGIHVLLTDPAPGGAPEPASAWRGYALSVSPLGDALSALERQKAGLLDFQERYRALVLKAGFYAARIDRTAARVFASTTPTGIALSLHRQILGRKADPPYRYALLAFSAVLLAAAILVRNKRALLALAGALSAGFFAFALLHPPGLRSLAVELALPEGEPRGIPLERVLPQTAREYRYRQPGIPPGSCTLAYRAFLAPGGEVPLQPFLREKLLRFHPPPEVRQAGERFLLHSPVPLSAWSLHGPQ
jgi:hypothetical protein